jgi:glucosamine 6-phosphate synthetase-like amidotransferase/phosphosugar isomerase protein
MVPPETQGYTTAILTGYLWAVVIANKLGYLNDELLNKKMDNINYLLKVMPNVVTESKKWVDINSEEILAGVKFYFMGDGLNFVTAFEGSLKFGETNRVAFRPMETEESSHVIDLAFDSDTYTMFIVSDNDYYQRAVEIAEFTKQVTEHVFVISDKYSNSKKDLCFNYNVDEELTPLMFVIPFQVMGASIALKKGYDTSCYPYNLNSIAHNEDYIFLK